MMTMCLMLPLRTREARLQSTLSAPLTSRSAPQLPIILDNIPLLQQLQLQHTYAYVSAKVHSMLEAELLDAALVQHMHLSSTC